MPGPLVDGGWLEEQLGRPDLVVLDVTVHLDVPSEPGRPYDVRSGLPDWRRRHVPGARFADVPGELSDPDAPYPFTLPSGAHFARGMERLGVGDDTFVVAYDATTGMWASRLWWMLRAFGHDQAAVLDGGLAAWRAAGRPVSAEAPAPAGVVTFTPRFRPGVFVGRDEVAAALDDDDVLLVNALAPEHHRGDTPRYGRAGHIPGSVNVPAATLLDEHGRFLPPEGLHDALAPSGAMDARRVITYCGGGISATTDALALTMLGHDDVAVYDGSMREWADDQDLPLERG